MGMRMAALLERKLADGVEVRVIVDGFGSRPYEEAREMFTGLADGGSGDRRQRRVPARPGRPLPRRPAARLAPGRGRPRRPSEAVRRRRRGRLDGRSRHRGPLRERRLPRRDGARHRRRRAAGAGGVPDELPRPRRPAADRSLALLSRAGRAGLDADRPRPGHPRRLRRGLAGDSRADRRGARPSRRDERRISRTAT